MYQVELRELQEDLDLIVKIVCLISILSFILSLIYRNVSIVDMIWSISPIGYVMYFTFKKPSIRLYIMTTLTFIWGFRLSWNLYLKGGYSLQFEDYRWDWIRKRVNPILFQ